ncbi:MAG: hypothetical protein K1X82_04080 [Bacteroidia bacterium]|nr:hypothetical protein [Bacteroidia bacterium]
MSQFIPDLSNMVSSWNNFERRMAQLLSIVFQPMFMPLLTAWMLFNSHTYIDFTSEPVVRKFVYLTLLLTTVILPVMVFGYLFRKKIITTYHIDKREERKYAFVVTIFFMGLTYWIFSQTSLPSIFYAMIIGGMISILISALITLLWKISIHMMGVGGLVGSVAGLSYLLKMDLSSMIYFSLFISGLTGFARLKLFAHTPAQVYWGFTLGIVVMFLTVVGLG